MRLKLTLESRDAAPVDVVVEADQQAPVSQVVRWLCTRQSVIPFDDVTLGVRRRDGVVSLTPTTLLADAGLRAGDVVSLVEATANTLANPPAVTVRVVAGPDTGLSVRLPPGQTDIGRDPSCAIRLSDPMVSQRHARLMVSDRVEVVDNGSSNGVQVAGEFVSHAVVGNGNDIVLGGTTILISHEDGGWSTARAGVEPFNRSPWLDPHYEGVKLRAPEPPQPPQPHRFPIALVVMPIFMAAVLYLITRNVATIAFVALSPLLMLGSYFENRSSSKKGWKASVEAFHDSMSDLVVRMQRAMEREQAGRRHEHPSSEETVAAAAERHPMLWCRRPDRPSFLDVRLGLGTQPSRNAIEMTSTRNTTPELWAELSEVVERFATVDRVPVVAALTECGAIGVAGGDPIRLDAARGLMVQLAALHSPAELAIAAIVPPLASPDWNWLKWLPHVDSEHSPLEVSQLASSGPAAATVLAALDDLIDGRTGDGNDPRTYSTAVVVLIDEDAPFERPRLVDLAERGPAAGVFTVWLGQDRTRLPSVCHTFLEVDAQTMQLGTGTVSDGSYVMPVEVGLVNAAAAQAFARSLAPVMDAGALLDDAADLPSTVSFVNEQGLEMLRDPSAVIDRWRQSGSISAESADVRGERSLRAFVGMSATGPLMLDLRAHGPHALVGGTTGSGKSEFLQTWLLGLAAMHSPERVNFLLVDYKGGAAFGECAALPHSVGLVTDLNNRLVRRALTSLRSELTRREQVLQVWRAKDLVDLEAKELVGAPVVPSLIIVVDEFAALVQEIPEFVDGMVDIAQRGRSLGLHLVLATQRPSGVIKGNLRANTNLRVALRVADQDDSHDVIGSAAAAAFHPDTPGRAVAKLGPGKLVPFQAGYVGGWTTNEPPEPNVHVWDMPFGPGAPWEAPPSSERGARDPGPKDIQRLCGTIGAAFEKLAMATPLRPWLPELATTYELSRLPTRRLDSELVFAVRDDPASQRQIEMAFEPDRDGNLIAFGASGTGRTTFLRTIAVAAGFSVKGGACAVYGLDFASRGLAMLEALPHTTVITADDDERVARLIRQLRVTVDERAAQFAAVKAGSIVEYRARAESPQELRVVVLVDGLGAFCSAYDTIGRRALFDQFQSIAQGGRALGVHIVATTDRVNSIGASLMSAFPSRLAFRVADELDLGSLGVPSDAFDDNSPPGRAYYRGAEIQVAVLGGEDASVASQAEAIANLARSMKRAGSVAVPSIERLRTVVPLSELPASVGGAAVFGLSDETLGPVGFKPEGLVVITGPVGSGRTTCLNTALEAVRRSRPGVRGSYLGIRRSAIVNEGGWTRHAVGDEEVARLAEQMRVEIDEGTLAEGVIVLEALEEFTGGEAEHTLQRLFRQARSSGVCILVDGEISLMSQSYGIAKEARASRQSLVLQPDSSELEAISGLRIGRLDAASFPPGRGFYCTQAGATRVQVAMQH